MTEKIKKIWNMTASQRKIQFFDESKEELEKRVEKIEKKLDKLLNILEKKLD
tara:strand:+ start:391 stop:546 length:156 start_codon:yes stop_codon:yes gene_type:complete